MLYFAALDAGDKEIIGAIAGALLGAMGAYVVGLLVEKRTKKNAAMAADSQKVREYSRNISAAELSCQETLSILFDAQRLFKQCADDPRIRGWMITLPRRIKLQGIDVLAFRNAQLISEWTTLMFQINKINHLIDEFTRYYIRIADKFHDWAITGVKADKNVVDKSYESSAGFAGSILEQVNKVIDSTLDVYALVLVHAELSNYELVRIMSTDRLNSFTANEAHFKKIRERINDEYSAEKLFGPPGK